MNLKTFQASTMAEALARVKTTLGSEAVILHTRVLHKPRWLGLRRQEIYEITAGRGMRVPERPVRRPVIPDSYREAAARKEPASALAAAPGGTLAQKLLQTPAAQVAAMAGIAQEMTALKSMVKDLVSQNRARVGPDVPQDLFDFYMKLIQNQVAEDLAAEIIKTLQKQLRPEYLNQPDYVRQRLAEQLEKLIPSSGPIVRTKSVGPHVVALIGPTGVGKTTTLAKLAANLKLRQRRRIGLITIDTYRIAAVDQLRKYAEILDVAVRAVASPEDLRLALRAMQDCEFVLIDTAGRSPNDELKLNELKTFLTAAEPDEVHLVLSTTASQECVEQAVNRFTEVRVDRIIFTKLDEACHVGVVLNVARKLNKSLSYITTGQDVPADIEVSQGSRLAQLILGGSL
jgi:flagellar biosynthesis protein FlhF